MRHGGNNDTDAEYGFYKLTFKNSKGKIFVIEVPQLTYFSKALF
jgi:hypothetical protein